MKVHKDKPGRKVIDAVSVPREFDAVHVYVPALDESKERMRPASGASETTPNGFVHEMSGVGDPDAVHWSDTSSPTGMSASPAPTRRPSVSPIG